MARIRSIKADFFTSADVLSLSPLARLLYVGLWCEADREGRFKWTPVSFRYRYLPADACDIEAVAAELTARRMVVRYGDGLAVIPSFLKHQRPNPREQASIFPAPVGELGNLDVHAANLDSHGANLDLHAQGGMERNGKEGNGKEGSDAPPLALVPTLTFNNDYGAMPTRKRNPSMEWEGQREGLGVPTKLHTDLLSRMGTPDERALLAWYAETERAWQGKAVGETCWQFWNARFAEWQGQTPTARKVHRYGVGPAPTSKYVAVEDHDCNGQGTYKRFHCEHEPTCTAWAQHRDRDTEAVSA
jgi:hypothetical protein